MSCGNCSCSGGCSSNQKTAKEFITEKVVPVLPEFLQNIQASGKEHVTAEEAFQVLLTLQADSAVPDILLAEKEFLIDEMVKVGFSPFSSLDEI